MKYAYFLLCVFASAQLAAMEQREEDAASPSGITHVEQPKAKRGGSRIAVKSLELEAIKRQEDEDLKKALQERERESLLQELARYKKSADLDDDRAGLTVFHRAVKYGDTATVRLLIKKADLHEQTADGLTALHLAASYGHDEIVALLLEHGAEVSAVTSEGLTPLHCAARGGFFSIAGRLLLSGASANGMHARYGLPLHLAALSGNIETVALFIESTQNIDAADGAGWTALGIAALHGHTDAVLKLLEKGASRSLMIGALTIEQWAQAKGHNDTSFAIKTFKDNQRRSQNQEVASALRASFEGVLPTEHPDLVLGITTAYDGRKRTEGSPSKLTPRSGQITPLSGRSPRSGRNTPRAVEALRASANATPPVGASSSDLLRISGSSAAPVAAVSSPRLSLRSQTGSPRPGQLGTTGSPRSPKGVGQAETANRAVMSAKLERRKSANPTPPAGNNLTKRRTIHQFLVAEKLPNDATQLERAVVGGVHAITSYLIKTRKGDLTQINELDSKGYALIHYAVLHENLEALNYLLDEGAEVNIITGVGVSPLSLAAQKQFYAGMTVLIKRGATVRSQGEEKPWYQYLPKAIEGEFVHQLILSLNK